ncbi:MAG: hypothetical protein LBP40_04965 [Campylobacteraceae bacterium]|jgi:hypothetical protein|nr:hypothetical protein [Campylobacteraceae bacterium]
MTIVLKNIDFKILEVIERLKVLKSDMKIIKKPNDKTLKAVKEAEKITKTAFTQGYKDW